jgi:hypothetical protein
MGGEGNRAAGAASFKNHRAINYPIAEVKLARYDRKPFRCIKGGIISCEKNGLSSWPITKTTSPKNQSLGFEIEGWTRMSGVEKGTVSLLQWFPLTDDYRFESQAFIIGTVSTS